MIGTQCRDAHLAQDFEYALVDGLDVITECFSLGDLDVSGLAKILKRVEYQIWGDGTCAVADQ